MILYNAYGDAVFRGQRDYEVCQDDRIDHRRLEQEMSQRDDQIDELRKRLDTQTDYAICLQRAIEYHCRGERVPELVASGCRHHAEMLDAGLPKPLPERIESPGEFFDRLKEEERANGG